MCQQTMCHSRTMCLCHNAFSHVRSLCLRLWTGRTFSVRCAKCSDAVQAVEIQLRSFCSLALAMGAAPQLDKHATHRDVMPGTQRVLPAGVELHADATENGALRWTPYPARTNRSAGSDNNYIGRNHTGHNYIGHKYIMDPQPGSDKLIAYSNGAAKLAQLWGSTSAGNALKTTVWRGCSKIIELVQVSECRVHEF